MFGANQLFPHKNLLLENDLVFQGGKFAKLSLDSLKKIVGNENFAEVIKNNQEMEKKQREQLNMDFRKEEKDLKMKDLLFLKELGEG